MKKIFTCTILAIGMLITAVNTVCAEQTKKPSACDLKSDMRKLWEDHIIWTRNVIFNIIDGLPGTTEAVNRLLQNQVDIGNAIKPYYGESAGNQLTALLHDHITIAADLLTSLKNDNTPPFGDTPAFTTAYAAWVANADARKFDIKTKGEGNVTFYPPVLSKGVFTYSILAEGKLIDTKKMIH